MAEAFPVNLSGHLCIGLPFTNKSITSPEACRQKCCATGGCNVWQFCTALPWCKGCHYGRTWIDQACQYDKWPQFVGEGFVQPDAPVPPAPRPTPADSDFDDSKWEAVNVPHDYLIAGGGTGAAGQAGIPRGVAWYRKSFMVPEDWKGSSISVEFDGIFKFAAVWLNGVFLRSSVLGYLDESIRLDVHNGSNPLHYGPSNTNVLAIFVSADHGSEWWCAAGFGNGVRFPHKK